MTADDHFAGVGKMVRGDRHPRNCRTSRYSDARCSEATFMATKRRFDIGDEVALRAAHWRIHYRSS
jgi:hypothetical protein